MTNSEFIKRLSKYDLEEVFLLFVKANTDKEPPNLRWEIIESIERAAEEIRIDLPGHFAFDRRIIRKIDYDQELIKQISQKSLSNILFFWVEGKTGHPVETFSSELVRTIQSHSRDIMYWLTKKPL